MEEDTVPEGLLAAFSDKGGGEYRARHFFARDLAAVAVALAVAVAYAVLTVGAVLVINRLWGDDTEGALALAQVVGLR